jgi:hypothetical protein
MLRSELPQLLFIGFKNAFFDSFCSVLPKDSIELSFQDFSFFSHNNTSSFDYIIIDCFSAENGVLAFLRDESLLHFIHTESQKQNRILILLPHTVSFESKSHIENRLSTIRSQNSTVGIVFVARILDENLFQFFPLRNDSVEFPNKSSLFSFIKTSDALQGIQRCLFSLKAYGNTQSLYGVVTRPEHLAFLFERKGYSISYNPSLATNVLSAEEVIMKPFSIEKLIEDIPSVVSESMSPIHTEVEKPENYINPPLEPKLEPESKIQPVTSENTIQTLNDQPKTHKTLRKYVKLLSILKRKHRKKDNQLSKKVSPKKWTKGIFLGIIILFLPYIVSGLSLLITKVSVGNITTSQSSLLLPFSQTFSKSSERLSTAYVSLPVLGNRYLNSLSWSRISVRLSEAGKEAVQSTVLKKKVLSALVTSSDENINATLDQLTLSYESLYSDLGFLVTEISELQFGKNLIGSIVTQEDIVKVQRASLSSFKLLKGLGGVTGQKKQTVYAVILQDETILRPTGGKISALALVTFERGTITNTEVLNLEEGTKNFDGIVTPPSPLSLYFSHDNWDLTEGNWDYSFPVASEKILWFIDKEFDRHVDGVISLSTDAVTTILKADNRTVPESYSDKLSYGIQGIIDILSHSDPLKETILPTLLKDKQMLIYTNSEAVNSALSDFSWNNSFDKTDCEGNCISDRFALNESSVSGDATLLKREGSFQIVLSENELKRDFTYYIKNQNSSEYKAYIRLIAPQDSEFESVSLLNEEGKKTLESHVYGQRNDKESGVFVTVPQGKTIGISFSWKSSPSASFDASGSYNLFIQRQPGVSSYPIDLKASFPQTASIIPESPFQLTKEGQVHYNTVLGADLNSRINWTK